MKKLLHVHNENITLLSIYFICKFFLSLFLHCIIQSLVVLQVMSVRPRCNTFWDLQFEYPRITVILTIGYLLKLKFHCTSLYKFFLLKSSLNQGLDFSLMISVHFVNSPIMWHLLPNTDRIDLFIVTSDPSFLSKLFVKTSSCVPWTVIGLPPLLHLKFRLTSRVRTL